MTSLGPGSLQYGEALFQRVFEDGPLGMAVVAPDYRLLRVNRVLAEMLGYAESELTCLTFPDITHPDDIAPTAELAARLFAGEISRYTIEKRYVRQDGAVIWGRVSASAVLGGSGMPVCGLGMVEDITATKALERSLQVLREGLATKTERAPSAMLRTGVERAAKYGLTFRELTVLQLVIAGQGEKQIGAALGISHFTVNKHVSNVIKRMGAASRLEACVRAIRERIVE